MLSLLQSDDPQGFPSIKDFADLSARHIEEALGKSCEDAEIHFRAIRLVFYTLHNYNGTVWKAEDDGEEEAPEEPDDEQTADDLSSNQPPQETKEERCRRIRKMLNKSLPEDLILESRQAELEGSRLAQREQVYYI